MVASDADLDGAAKANKALLDMSLQVELFPEMGAAATGADRHLRASLLVPVARILVAGQEVAVGPDAHLYAARRVVGTLLGVSPQFFIASKNDCSNYPDTPLPSGSTLRAASKRWRSVGGNDNRCTSSHCNLCSAGCVRRGVGDPRRYQGAPYKSPGRLRPHRTTLRAAHAQPCSRRNPANRRKL